MYAEESYTCFNQYKNVQHRRMIGLTYSIQCFRDKAVEQDLELAGIKFSTMDCPERIHEYLEVGNLYSPAIIIGRI